MTEKTPGPFDYLRVISDKSDPDLFDRHTGRGYNQFVINRALSYYPDTIVDAATANKLRIDSDMHWTFLLSSVRKKKRYPRKWAKPPTDERVEKVAKHYGISIVKAWEILPLLPASFVDALL